MNQSPSTYQTPMVGSWPKNPNFSNLSFLTESDYSLAHLNNETQFPGMFCSVKTEASSASGGHNSHKKISLTNLKAQDFIPNINNNNNVYCYNNAGNMASNSYPNKLEAWKPQMFLPELIEENENDGIVRSFLLLI